MKGLGLQCGGCKVFRLHFVSCGVCISLIFFPMPGILRFYFCTFANFFGLDQEFIKHCKNEYWLAYLGAE